MIMKVLVTGGLGFIGSNFIRYYLEKYPKDNIINLDKITYAGNPDNLKDIKTNYKFVKGDICDPKAVNQLVKESDIVVNFAAESHVDNSIKNPGEFVRTNVVGTQVILSACLEHKKRIHHISTDEVFGELGPNGKFTLETPYNPRSPYSASKAASDHLVRAYFHTYKLPITISNCSNNYGPYQYPEKVIPLFITNLMTGKKVPVYGKGNNVRDWIYVIDHCEAIDLIINKGQIGKTYLVGGDCELQNIELTKIIISEMGFTEDKIEYVEDRKGHDFRYAIDHSKTTEELGWKPRTEFKEGIKKTIEWYKQNQEWWQKLLR
jgi:dTDP-glucose 4,6-dehydratase